jgi:hypothetical protein
MFFERVQCLNIHGKGLQEKSPWATWYWMFKLKCYCLVHIHALVPLYAKKKNTNKCTINYRYKPHNDVSVNDGPHIRRWSHNIIILIIVLRGSGSSLTTGWTVRGSNPGGGKIFRPSRPALGPNQPPVKWVPGISRG